MSMMEGDFAVISLSMFVKDGVGLIIEITVVGRMALSQRTAEKNDVRLYGGSWG